MSGGVDFVPNSLDDINFWYAANTRSGLTLPNSLTPGTGDASLLLPYLNKPSGTEYAYVSDNGGLDILATDFTYCGWVKAESTNKTNLKYLFGKSNFAAAQGSYTVCMNNTTGYIRAYVNSSTGVKSIVSDVDFTSGDWFFVLVEVDQANKLMRLFINNVQNQADLSYTGTFPAMANDYKFEIGSGQNGTNQYSNGVAFSSHSDTYVYKRLLTPTEKTTLYNRGIVNTPLAHYPCNSWVLHDAGPNGYHLTGVNLTAAKKAYGTTGSRHLLDKGYTLYRGGAVEPFYYVPYTDAGAAIATPTIPENYYIDSDVPQHAGSLVNHNLADSFIIFSGAGWDRSSETIYNAMAREASTRYLSGTPKAWHITEVNHSVIHHFSNVDYNGTNFPKITGNSTWNRGALTEIISYTDNKTAANLKNILTYTGDIDGYCEIDYYFETNHICTQRGAKVLAFNSTSKVMSLSNDGGVTFPITLDLTGIITIVTRARIYPNGNIMWAGHTKCYYSDDSLATYQESTTLGIDGNTYVPTTYTNFRTLNEIENTVYDDIIDLWTAYSTEAGTQVDNINVWCSEDSGATVKSVFKFGVSEPVVAARHGHAVSYNPADGSFWVHTGDTDPQIHWMKFVRTAPYTFTVTNPVNGGANTYIQGVGHWFEGDRMYWLSEFFGIWRVNYADLADATKHERVNANDDYVSRFNNEDGKVILTNYVMQKAVTISRNDSKTFYKHFLTGGPNFFADWGGYQVIHPANSAGYHKIEIFAEGEAYPTWTAGTVLMLKITTL